LLVREMQDLMNRMASAYVAGDAAACAALFVPMGELYSPFAPPARGRAAIEALHRIWTEGVEEKRLDVVDAGCAGDLAWCHATYSEGDPAGSGRSLSVLERQKDGTWLIRICVLNGADPPADV